MPEGLPYTYGAAIGKFIIFSQGREGKARWRVCSTSLRYFDRPPDRRPGIRASCLVLVRSGASADLTAALGMIFSEEMKDMEREWLGFSFSDFDSPKQSKTA